MCKRHSNEEFDFVCLTDDPRGIIPEVKIFNLPKTSLHGWWLKMYVFNKSCGFEGDVLFLDLDLVICDSINKLWNYKSGNFIVIRDFTRHVNPSWDRFNSSVFRFNVERNYWIWDKFHNEYREVMKKLHGDQDYLYSILKNYAMYWPDDWIRSYKWEIRNKNEIQIINGKRNFTTVTYPKINPECCITVFHGDPKPADVKDPWVINNWQ